MKRMFLLILSAILVFGFNALPVSANNDSDIGTTVEEWDDFDNPNIEYFDYQGNKHACDICGLTDNSKDVLSAVTWFQGSHLKNKSAHFLHVGSYAVITVENCVNLQWWTQYRGPAGYFSSTEAEVYVDDVLVATLGEDVLNGNNLTDPFMFWDSGTLDSSVKHVIRIVNTCPMSEDFEGSEEEWYGRSQYLPIDYFMVTTLSNETPDCAEDTPSETSEPIDTSAKDADTSSGTATDHPSEPSEEASGCGSRISQSVLILAAASAAVFAQPAILPSLSAHFRKRQRKS